MPKWRVSSASPALVWLRQNATGSAGESGCRAGRRGGTRRRRGRRHAPLQFVEGDSHHARAHAATPALPQSRRSGRMPGIVQRFLGGRQGKPMVRPSAELEQLAVANDSGSESELFDLGADPGRKTPGVESAIGATPLRPATRLRPRGGGVESDRGHHADPVMATRRRSFMAAPPGRTRIPGRCRRVGLVDTRFHARRSARRRSARYARLQVQRRRPER